MNRRTVLRALFAPAAVVALRGSAVAGQDPKPADKVKDPVCGMTIDRSTAKGTSEHEGKTYYFCSDSCKKKFEADPKKYVQPPAPKQ